MNEIDRDAIAHKAAREGTNSRGRWVIVGLVLVTALAVIVALWALTRDRGQAETERDVAEAETEMVTGEADELADKIIAVCKRGGEAAETLPPGTCSDAHDTRDVIEESEVQDPEIDDPEVNDPDPDDPDPNDPDRPNDLDPDDPDPDDPEQNDADPDDPESNDPDPDDPENDDPEVQDEEFDDPETQEEEVQDPEVNDPDPDDPENQDPEVNDPQDPASSMTFHDMPGPGQTTTCDLIAGSGPDTPEYDCASTPPGEGSSLLSWWAGLAYLGLGQRRFT